MTCGFLGALVDLVASEIVGSEEGREGGLVSRAVKSFGYAKMPQEDDAHLVATFMACNSDCQSARTTSVTLQDVVYSPKMPVGETM